LPHAVRGLDGSCAALLGWSESLIGVSLARL